MPARARSLPIPLLVALGACGVERAESSDVSSDTADLAEVSAEVDASGAGFFSPFCRELPAGEPLTPGRWASRQRSAAIVNLPPTNTPTTVVTTRLILHDVVREGAETRLRHITCSLRQPKLNGVEVVFGPAFLSAVPENVVVARIDGDTVTVPADLVVLGAELTDDEALPTSADDARVRDSDEDGKPGVSVTLQGLFAGQLYVVYRQRYGLSGTADPAGCVGGRLEGGSEQAQLGAFPSELEVIDLAPRPHPDPSISTFQLVPLASLPGGPTLDCEGLSAREDELFGRAPD